MKLKTIVLAALVCVLAIACTSSKSAGGGCYMKRGYVGY
jgi:hypothetical protein